MTDIAPAGIGRRLLADVAALVDIPSPSHHEAALAAEVAGRLAGNPALTVERVGDNVVARSDLGRPHRVILAGHLDTVPAAGNEKAVVDGRRCSGLGSADMKGGLAVMLALAEEAREPAVDVTYLFYVCEEVDQRHSGLLTLAADRPDLLQADAAILGEPTDGRVEAGCQGNLRAVVTMAGRRAHTARPWMGVNAVHRLGPVLEALAAWPDRRPVLDGCVYRESVQAVRVEAGVAANVVPDRATLTINHRFAPDRDADAAGAALAEGLSGVLGPDDSFSVVASSAPAPPGLDHPLLARLVRSTGQAPVAKLGWTDVSFFAARGVPATNFGPGDPTLAHTPDEFVTADQLEQAYRVLSRVLAS